MHQSEIKEMCLELLKTAPAAYVTSIGADGYPYTRAMFNLRNVEQFPKQSAFHNGQDFTILLSTNTSSLKVAQMEHNARVSIYYCQPSCFQGFMLSGNIEIVQEQDIRYALWEDGWERYYPQGMDDPDYTVLRLQPGFMTGWLQGTKFKLDL